MQLGLARRVTLAFVALVSSALLFHVQIASSLVTRGDELARNNELRRAAGMYSRALRFDQDSIVAADRLAFLGIREHTVAGYRLAVRVASAGLRRDPRNPSLLLDRALGQEHLGHFAAALADFDRLASLEPDARTFEFAAQMALRLHDRRRAHERFARVLALDMRFSRARRGLAETR